MPIVSGHHHDRPPRSGRLIAGLTASLAALLVVAPVANGVGAKTGRAALQTAHVARTISLNESAHLRLTSKHGFTLNERGTATGTIAGPIYIHLTITSTSRVTAEVNIYPNGGSVTGYATASYRRGSQSAAFNGTMSIARGTGGYGHARGSNLSFSGTIQHSNDAVTVHVSGRVSV
jgi:hypothetical protein